MSSYPIRLLMAGVIAVVMLSGGLSSAWAGKLYPLGETTEVPRLSDEPVPFAVIPERPALPLELGCKFVGNGKLPDGVRLSTGAVWTPCLWVFGTSRTAVQTYEGQGDAGRNSEIATRLDMFVNLSLTNTEKCIVGISPLDGNRSGNFTRYSFESNQGLEGGRSEAGVYVRTAFCEGDFGSLFPDLDPMGMKLIDYGFSVGRQAIAFQEGIMINDTLDAVGIVRNNLHAPGFSNIRITGLAAIDHIDRGPSSNRQRLNEPYLFGLFTQGDTIASTWAFDFITIQDDDTNSTGGDGYFFGLSALQRGWNPFNGIGTINTAYRINASFGTGEDNDQVSDGALLSAEISWTPLSSDDVVYVNPFWGINRYSQASREPTVGGPLAPLGISFAGNSLGNYASELSGFNTQVVGVAVGYQAFWDQHRRNLVLEVAGVKDTTRGMFDTDGAGTDAAAFTVQFQQAIGQRVQLQLDAFVAYLEGRTNGSGSRAEILVQF